MKLELPREVSYHLEVKYKPGTYVSDMDFYTSDETVAYERLQHLKEIYPGRAINISRTTTTRVLEEISENDLEEVALNPNTRFADK